MSDNPLLYNLHLRLYVVSTPFQKSNNDNQKVKPLLLSELLGRTNTFLLHKKEITESLEVGC